MKNDIDVKKFRKEKTISLIEKYKGLIDNVFEIFDNNKCDSEDEEKDVSEQKKLERIKKRSTALEQVDVFLDRIEKLEHHLKEDEEERTDENGQKIPDTSTRQGYVHPTKRNAKN